MKKNAKRLVLAKETIYQLTEGNLKEIIGGSDTRYNSCNASNDRFCQNLATRGTC
jgi:hypothetical protein